MRPSAPDQPRSRLTLSPPLRAQVGHTNLACAIQGTGSGHAGLGEMVPPAQHGVSLQLLVSRELQTGGSSDLF